MTFCTVHHPQPGKYNHRKLFSFLWEFLETLDHLRRALVSDSIWYLKCRITIQTQCQDLISSIPISLLATDLRRFTLKLPETYQMSRNEQQNTKWEWLGLRLNGKTSDLHVGSPWFNLCYLQVKGTGCEWRSRHPLEPLELAILSLTI